MKTLNISDVVNESWQLLSKNYVLILLAFISYIILTSIGSILISTLPEDASGLIIILTLANIIFTYFVLAGFHQLGLNLVKERPASLGDFFSQSVATAMKLIVVNLLVSLIVLIGLILLIVPGIILALKYSMTFQVLIDERVGPLEAMSRSSQITNGNKLQLLLLGFVNLGIILLGALCLGVGLLVAIPLAWVTTFVSYEMLKAASSSRHLEDGVSR